MLTQENALATMFSCQERQKTFRERLEASEKSLELESIRERAARLVSQHYPVCDLDVSRDLVIKILNNVVFGAPLHPREDDARG